MDNVIDDQKSKRRYKAREKKLVLSDQVLRQLTALAEIQCTQKEAARVLCVSHRLLVQFLAENAEARGAWQRGKGIGRVSLRRLLWKQAQGNPAQAQFLAKHWLGMNASRSQPVTSGNAVVLTEEERIKRILELQAKARRAAD